MFFSCVQKWQKKHENWNNMDCTLNRSSNECPPWLVPERTWFLHCSTWRFIMHATSYTKVIKMAKAMQACTRTSRLLLLLHRRIVFFLYFPSNSQINCEYFRGVCTLLVVYCFKITSVFFAYHNAFTIVCIDISNLIYTHWFVESHVWQHLFAFPRAMSIFLKMRTHMCKTKHSGLEEKKRERGRVQNSSNRVKSE